jgi:TolB protein
MVALTAIAVAALPSAAHATFPGKNGKIAFIDRVSAPTPHYDVFVVNPDGTGRTRLTFHAADDTYPAWSPDGTKIAFTSARDDPFGDIYVMNADGSGVVRLTNNDFREWEPAWSPDGTAITFTRKPCQAISDCAFVVMKMNQDGSDQQPLTEGLDATWAPDGTQIAFSRQGDLYLMNPDGSGVSLLNVGGSNPDWSADGRKIGFVDDTCADIPPEWCDEHIVQFWLVTINRDGTGYRSLVANGGRPAWAPDGTKIAWLYLFGGSGQIALMDPDGNRNSWDPITPGNSPSWQAIPINAYPRPRSATGVDVSLVPAYNSCTAPNRQHGPPLAYDSCNPPASTSDEATLGSPDNNGKPAKGQGVARYAALGTDVRITFEAYDVYDHTTLADYTGELRVRSGLRITDKRNTPHPGGPGAATVSDTSLGATVLCAATGDTTTGSSCLLTTTANAIAPGSVTAGARSVWELGQVQVDDGGNDGDVDTGGDNTLFMVQGVFVP